jgi:hypothetical protein
VKRRKNESSSHNYLGGAVPRCANLSGTLLGLPPLKIPEDKTNKQKNEKQQTRKPSESQPESSAKSNERIMETTTTIKRKR